MQAVIDVPADNFDTTAEFWAVTSNSRLDETHPEHPEFVHVVPEAGDSHLELQRIDQGPASVHLDLLVEDIPAVTERAISLGATLISQPGHAVLHTPGGVPFCVVPFGGESERAPLISNDYPHAVDQICLDVPYEHFDDDVRFWSDLTGWNVNTFELPEFRSLAQPAELPLRILIQRLGSDDTGPARAHLDVSSGEHVAALTIKHVDAGATVVHRMEHWTALADPSGQQYCLTGRTPSAS